ncbi:hypothetical protein [Tuwongella immobilis]|uniref:Glycosyltransferase RgtA/B/C/D-like domain-containing protein n=1 Tax=Tuwongella immobilis TaxID=692036 RepID=A0A6C2YR05_9BACT|nr:hypothetical protein [Tuwongella immobilis]VIP03787.1 Uncharacterized protein OS=Clostridium sp. Maddingley MBC34-26 GN=A370_05537 PE=4 SV=1 [Tuwongella immobilis]VTS04942.1 Uncharacterized protein OS=Clostridium sp. Maddingley MBC34-26 GN=A370_05537 PE=4 SV=1 [Tuwongella immobilis]
MDAQPNGPNHSPVGARITMEDSAPNPISDALVAFWKRFGPYGATALVTVGCMGLFWLLQVFITHSTFSGNFAWTLFLSRDVGIPEVEVSQGITPVIAQSEWDAEYGYHLANDPWLTNPDTVAHLDLPIHRGQAIFFPALSWGLAKIAGLPIVPPRLFLLLHWAVIAFGIGAVAGWLVRRGMSLLWVVPLATSWVMLRVTSHGVSTAAGDALIALTLIAVSGGHWCRFLIVGTALTLARPDAIFLTAGVTLATALKQTAWQTTLRGRPLVLLSAIPTAVPLLLVGVLHVRFPGEAVTLGIGLTPWQDWFSAISTGFGDGQIWASLWRIGLTAIALHTLVRCLRNWGQSPIATVGLLWLLGVILLPGWTWQTTINAPIAVGGVLLVSLFLTAIDSSALNRGLFLALTICHVGLIQGNLLQVGHWSPHQMVMQDQLNRPILDRELNSKLVDVTSSATWVNHTETLPLPTNLWKMFHRESIGFLVRLENRTQQPWHPLPQSGENTISLAVEIRNEAGDLVHQQRSVPICHSVAPGEAIEQVIPIALKRGKYQVRVSGYQIGIGWFDDANSANGSRYVLELK